MDNRATAAISVTSRIENDIEAVKGLKNRVDAITDRIIRHARALGYYEPQPEQAGGVPMPVITTLADAIRDLDRVIDRASGSLNVFD